MRGAEPTKEHQAERTSQHHTAPQQKARWRKTQRLRQRSRIRTVFRRGKRLQLGWLRGFVAVERDERPETHATEPTAPSRFLIAVKKSAGHSPQRHRIQRLLREALRRQLARQLARQSALQADPHNPPRVRYDVCLLIAQPLPKKFLQQDEADARIAALLEALPGVLTSTPPTASPPHPKA